MLVHPHPDWLIGRYNFMRQLCAQPKLFRSIAAFAVLLTITACTPRSELIDVRGQPVPTAIFVFFDQNAAEPQEASKAALNEAAAFLVQFDNTVARIVGHAAPDEPLSDDPGQNLDTRRTASIGAELMRLGVPGDRIQPLSAGRTENMSSSAADADIDRRVDILFGVR